MKKLNKAKIRRILSKTNVVGVIASIADLEMAIAHPNDADIYEYRADKAPQLAFYAGVKAFSERASKPIILTFRHTSEGSERDTWGGKNRSQILRDYMPIATFIDIEAATAEHNADLIEYAKQSGVGVIISQHILAGADYGPAMTVKGLSMCKRFGGDVFKTALEPNLACEFGQFVSQVLCLQDSESAERHPTPIAAMAMGEKFGKVSRLLFGINKSPLIYGSLSKAVVTGQWKVYEIQKMLEMMK